MKSPLASDSSRPLADYAPLALRLLLGALFIAHLYLKFAIIPGGIHTWWAGLIRNGYPPYVPYYVLSAEFAAALLLIPGVFSRYVALYAMPMMAGAAQYWLVRKGFYFTGAGAELPLVWLALLGLQVMLGDGVYALAPSPDLRKLLGGKASVQASPAG
ncbi:MAG TPA: DoxX family membrane protein [Caulobacteraceae bacterium]|jgi:putative oxidoreductase|nr:DoxX family membrane protein [Caulobacteraceae bacterium]